MTMFKHFSLALALSMLAVMAHAQEWGDLDGTFVFKGTPPTPAKLQVTKDPEYCGKHDLVDEAIIVNKENSGIVNVVVYLADTMKPKIHPDYAKSANEEVIVDNENCR